MRLEKRTQLLRDEIKGILDTAGIPAEFKEVLWQALSKPGRLFSTHEAIPGSLLPLFICEATGGRWEKVILSAAAIELWLAAADVFDDLEDRDAGGLWETCGESHAINAATALLFLAQQAILHLHDKGFDGTTVLRVMDTICNAATRSCAGQYLDIEYESCADVTEEEYFNMTATRSGSQMECACRVGAMLGTHAENTITAFGIFGHNLGIYFQVTNDVRSLSTEHGVKSDISRRKKTLPIIYGLGQASGEERDLLYRVFSGKEEVLPSIEDEVRHILSNLGAMQYSLVIADIYRQKALKALDATCIDNAAIMVIKEVFSPEIKT